MLNFKKLSFVILMGAFLFGCSPHQLRNTVGGVPSDTYTIKIFDYSGNYIGSSTRFFENIFDLSHHQEVTCDKYRDAYHYQILKSDNSIYNKGSCRMQEKY
ncbi:hypothetical protein H0A36_07865 [Endozoicomonas sp. SM1973]|uniref:Lipoprotein n=1 Tax=Spartinivicinus marinus TaxID=2994442 RepID=A0A853HZZ5_9GAMM|nr:hypothetical protein [Spartinivicinus marinus]MCX4025209.1 hypothetical protein [Spartinivicinus marinus]NYZ65929.1 hypothetical protein [Spartinivicinus marinus]